jgi:hypothetical protein
MQHAWKRRGMRRVLVRMPEGERPLGRLRNGWQDAKMNLSEKRMDGKVKR